MKVQVRAVRLVEGNVTAGTQNQAKCALLFLFQRVLGRVLAFLDVARAVKSERLPVVLSRPEISLLLPLFRDLRLLMFLLTYGAGLRHRECRRRRVKDICCDEGHIVVRSGKGDHPSGFGCAAPAWLCATWFRPT